MRKGKSAGTIHPFLAHSCSSPIPCQHHLASFLFTLTLIEGQQPLAQSDALWGHFDQFIIADILNSIVEAQDARRFQPDPSSAVEERMLVRCLRRQTFTSRSRSRMCCPTIIPS